MKADDLFARITDTIINMIETGNAGEYTTPWAFLTYTTPKSADGRPYRGINTIWLALAAAEHGWTSGVWATYQQWQKHDCQVRKGEKATHVILWKPVEKPNPETGETDKLLLARTFAVFAAEQAEGAEDILTRPAGPERHDHAEQYFAQIGAAVHYGGNRAAYSPAADMIAMPHIEQFTDTKQFYATLAHEHVHWTGHERRLDRDLTGRFGSESYAMEELTAELGAAMWSGQHGMGDTTRRDHAAYIEAWLKVLRQDPRALVAVAGHAQRAVDWLNTAAGEAVTVAA